MIEPGIPRESITLAAARDIVALLPKVLDMLKGGSGGLSGLAGGVSKLFG